MKIRLLRPYWLFTFPVIHRGDETAGRVLAPQTVHLPLSGHHESSGETRSGIRASPPRLAPAGKNSQLALFQRRDERTCRPAGPSTWRDDEPSNTALAHRCRKQRLPPVSSLCVTPAGASANDGRATRRAPACNGMVDRRSDAWSCPFPDDDHPFPVRTISAPCHTKSTFDLPDR